MAAMTGQVPSSTGQPHPRGSWGVRQAVRPLAAALFATALSVGAVDASFVTSASAAPRTAVTPAAVKPAAVTPPKGTPAGPAMTGGQSQPTAAAISKSSGDEARRLGEAPQIASTSATTFTVDSTADSPLKTATGTTCVDSETTPKCSLRAAVQAANNLAAPVVINLLSATYNLSDTTLGALTVDNPGGTSIVGAGMAATTIAVPTGDHYRVITMTENSKDEGGTLWLTGLTVTGGNAPSGYGGGIQIYYASDAAILTSVAVTKNSAEYGGGIACGDEDYGASLWAFSSKITHDTAEVGGGIYSYYCGIKLTNTTVTNDTATDDLGGGIDEVYGSIDATGSQISNDTAYEGTVGDDGSGGGIYNEYGDNTFTNDGINHDTVGSSGVGGGDEEYYSRVTVTGGSFTGDAVGTDGYGAALEVEYGAQVALHGVSVTNNTAPVSADTKYGYGGAIYLYQYDYAATMTIDDGSTVSDNTGGGIVAFSYYGGFTLTVNDATLDGNSSTIAYDGGAITDYGEYYGGNDVTLTDDTFAKNSDTAEFSAGAIFNWADEYENASANLTGDTFTTNTSTGEEGSGAIIDYAEEYANVALVAKHSTFTGNTAPDYGLGGAIDAYGDEEYSPNTVRLDNDAFSHNVAGSNVTTREGFGGVLFTYYYANVTAVDSEFVDNSAVGTTKKGGNGGAFYFESYQSASFTGDLISGNQAEGQDSYGGGLYSEDEAGTTVTRTTFSDNTADFGGGFYQDGYTLALKDSTVSGNVALGDATGPGEGGAIYEDGQLVSTNSTIADNVAQNNATMTGMGGGLADIGSSSQVIDFTTIAGNTAATGAGIYQDGYGGTLRDSIVADNTTVPGGTTQSDCARKTKMTATTTFFSTFTSAGGNVFSQAGCTTASSFGDVVTAEPGLLPLAYNSGPFEATSSYPTETMGLTTSSPALEHAGTECPSTDERGVTRPQYGSCDSGAFEATQGFWLAASDGGVFTFGTAPFFGSMGGKKLNAPIVGIAATPTGQGYWEAAADGGVFSFGNATFFGSMGGKTLDAPIVGIAATLTGQGYWEAAADGGVFAFGKAQFWGSMGGQHLNAPIVGITTDPASGGYWLIASDGGIFAYSPTMGSGSATGFFGSMGGQHLNAPITGLTSTPTGGGYWEVASDGGVFNFGNAKFFGSMGGQHLNAPMVTLSATPDGLGYSELAADGGTFAFGDGHFLGSLAGLTLVAPIVGAATA
jgi:CSLREA domain-containing protein